MSEHVVAEQKVGTVDVFGLIERLMARPEMQGPVDELAKALNDRIAAAQQELEGLQRELQGMQASDPQAEATQQAFFSKREAFDGLVRQSTGELDRFRTDKLLEAYRLAREATVAVADRSGYTMVLASRGADAPIDRQGMALALQELLARPVLRGVPGDDLTGQVTAELKLE